MDADELDRLAGWIRLPDGTARKAHTWAEYSAWLNTGNFDELRRVARDVFNDGVEVSTVFLASDHACPGGPGPVLWETMVFGGDHNLWQGTLQNLLSGKSPDGDEPLAVTAPLEVEQSKPTTKA
jgi:hypothetical protein